VVCHDFFDALYTCTFSEWLGQGETWVGEGHGSLTPCPSLSLSPLSLSFSLTYVPRPLFTNIIPFPAKAITALHRRDMHTNICMYTHACVCLCVCPCPDVVAIAAVAYLSAGKRRRSSVQKEKYI